jgi:hypothetical protein
MPPPLVCYHASIRPGVLLRARLNDLPVYKTPHRGPDSRQGGANHLLVPGENELSIEILKAPPAEPTEFQPGEVVPPPGWPAPRSVRFALYTQDPEVWDGEPPALRRLPYRHLSRFDLGPDITAPIYLGARPADVGCEGTPDLFSAVAAVHEALASRDVDRFLELVSLKMSEYARAYEGMGDASVGNQQAATREFFAARPVIGPLDPTSLHFEARARGKVAVVTGVDDGCAITATTERDPNAVLRANLWLTQHDGGWRVIG